MTKKQRVADLLKRIKRGPAFSIMFGQPGQVTERQASEISRDLMNDYQIFVNTWILPELIRLIPQAQGKK